MAQTARADNVAKQSRQARASFDMGTSVEERSANSALDEVAVKPKAS
jgi:hypothetical protein